MSLYKKFKTSDEHEQNGVELDYGEGCIIKIARAGGANKRFLKCAEKFNRKYKRQLELEILINDIDYKAAVRMYAEPLVLSWEGVTDQEGNELECTVENVAKVLTDLPDLFSDIRRSATNHQLFKEYIDEKEAGN